jgi:hypothetical protein
MNKLSHWDYCQFLLVSQVNYTQTYFADHAEEISHDRINRLLREEHLSPRELRNAVRPEIVLSENGYILFDDTVLDKRHSFAIEVVRRQWSGNAKKVIKGIGIVTCVLSIPNSTAFGSLIIVSLIQTGMDAVSLTIYWRCGAQSSMWKNYLSVQF